jgi:hypothetical protein
MASSVTAKELVRLTASASVWRVQVVLPVMNAFRVSGKTQMAYAKNARMVPLLRVTTAARVPPMASALVKPGLSVQHASSRVQRMQLVLCAPVLASATLSPEPASARPRTVANRAILHALRVVVPSAMATDAVPTASAHVQQASMARRARFSVPRLPMASTVVARVPASPLVNARATVAGLAQAATSSAL